MKKVMAMIITTCIVILNNSVLTFGSTSSSNEKVFDTTKISCTELHGMCPISSVSIVIIV